MYGADDRLNSTLVLDGDFAQIEEGDKVLIALPELHNNDHERVAAGAVLYMRVVEY